VQLVHDATADELLVGKRVLDTYIDLLQHSLSSYSCARRASRRLWAGSADVFPNVHCLPCTTRRVKASLVCSRRRKEGADMLEYILRLADHLFSQRGEALAEYSLILGLVAIVCVLATGLLGLTLAAEIDRIA
jgi:hypothetical protein